MRPPRPLSASKPAQPLVKSRSQPWKLSIARWIYFALERRHRDKLRAVEGINRKIRGLLASAFGFRDQDFLKLRLYALHEAKFKFVQAKTKLSR